MRMKIIRPLLLFFTLFSIALTIYGQQIAEREPKSPQNAEVKVNVVNDANLVEIYPNPATSFLNINLTDSELKNVNFELYDIIGNKVSIETQELASNKYRIPVEKLHMGYYVLIVSDAQSRYKKAFKFSKK